MSKASLNVKVSLGNKSRRNLVCTIDVAVVSSQELNNRRSRPQYRRIKAIIRPAFLFFRGASTCAGNSFHPQFNLSLLFYTCIPVTFVGINQFDILL